MKALNLLNLSNSDKKRITIVNFNTLVNYYFTCGYSYSESLLIVNDEFKTN